MTQSLQMACQHCGSMLRVAPSMEGKQGKCPKCSQLTTIAASPPLSSTPPPFSQAAPNVMVKSVQIASSPPPSPLASLNLQQRSEKILAAFRGPIQPVKRPRSYMINVAYSALIMFILPLLYLLLVASIAGLICAHAAFDTWIFQANVRGKGAILLVIAYVGPIVAGVLVVLFMLKPLFARFPTKQATRSITREQEPLLFAFVDRVCDTVHAPRPRRIDVDCDVNASASFRRGMLSFFGNDLVLTIGLPLTAGLSLSQFGGVLAHEFGHFSQGAGMRLSYIIRSISHWFARVVGERDNWDLWLEQTAKGTDIRIGAVLYLAMAGVWLSRRVLSWLMYVGYFVASMLLREMEFDADQSETRFAGSATFAATSRKMRLLGLSFHGAINDAYRAFQEDRLADNLPKLMLHRQQQIPEKLLTEMFAELEKEKTGRFDTHPCDRERIERAKKENAQGVFSLDEPASLLFTDFDALARLSTCDYYTDVVGIKIRPGILHPVEEMLKEQESEVEAEKALTRLIGQTEPFRKIEMPPLNLKANVEEQVVYLKQARDYINGHRANYLASRLMHGICRTAVLETHSRHALLRAGAKLKGDGPRDLASSAAKKRDDEAIEQTTAELLTVYENCMGQRISSALSIVASGHFANGTHPFSEAARQLPRWHTAKRMLDALVGDRAKLEEAMVGFVSLLGNLEGNQERPGYVDSVISASKEVAGLVNDLRRRTADLPYPLDHRDKSMTVAKFFRPEPLLTPEQIGESYEGGATTLEKYDDLNRRLTARLALMAEQVESALGLPPLMEPPTMDKLADEQLRENALAKEK